MFILRQRFCHNIISLDDFHPYSCHYGTSCLLTIGRTADFICDGFSTSGSLKNIGLYRETCQIYFLFYNCWCTPRQDPVYVNVQKIENDFEAMSALLPQSYYNVTNFTQGIKISILL